MIFCNKVIITEEKPNRRLVAPLSSTLLKTPISGLHVGPDRTVSLDTYWLRPLRHHPCPPTHTLTSAVVLHHLARLSYVGLGESELPRESQGGRLAAPLGIESDSWRCSQQSPVLALENRGR